MFELEDDEFADEEDLEELPVWMREERAQRQEVLDSDDYLALPSSFEIHEYQIMEDFCCAFEDAETSNRLLGLIRGPGAFGRFRSAIRTLGAENAWYQFREQALVEIAVDWLEANEIPYIPLARPTLAKSAVATAKTGPSRVLNDWDASHTGTSSKRRQPKNEPDRVATQPNQPRDENEIKVFISHRNSKCGECGEELGTKAWITLEENKGALCLACADLDELVFLPSGDAALTRRSKKYSNLSAVVLKFSKARGRYERQGLLVEERALEQPKLSAWVTARLESDGMNARENAGMSLMSSYDQLLGRGWFRNEARGKVRNRVEEIAEKWQVGGLA
jgi:hypothetical protein